MNTQFETFKQKIKVKAQSFIKKMQIIISHGNSDKILNSLNYFEMKFLVNFEVCLNFCLIKILLGLVSLMFR